MRVIFISLFVAVCSAANPGVEFLNVPTNVPVNVPVNLPVNVPVNLPVNVPPPICPEYLNVIDEYRDAIYNFTIESYKYLAPRENYQFVASPHSMWLTLAAIAEGADSTTQEQLFELLRLPADFCIRQKYYEIAASRFSYTADASVVSTRVLIIDDGVTPNLDWYNFITQSNLLDVTSVPIKNNPVVAADQIRQIANAKLPLLNLRGNSVLVNTMDFNGLWETAFTDAVVERAPFYTVTGRQIGKVDLMTVKRYAKVGYVPSLGARTLELTLGENSQYSLVIALVVANSDIRPLIRQMKSTIIPEVLGSLQESPVPIDIALPQITLQSEVDAKAVLESLGVRSLWTNPEATRYITDPPALPSSYVQRSTLTFNKYGVNPPPTFDLRSNISLTSPEDSFFSEFKADRPFMFLVFDTETYTCLMANMFTRPAYFN